uniref:hepatocyte growth factor-like protein isoform X2 n=1 Tax=Myxine glutinosa TaxID=7769 RepID=UPI00358F9CDF
MNALFLPMLFVLLLVSPPHALAGRYRFHLDNYMKSEFTALESMTQHDLPRRVSRHSVQHCARICDRHRDCRAFQYNLEHHNCELFLFNRRSRDAKLITSTHTTLYEHKDYIRECFVESGTNYRGQRNQTISEIECQRWSDSEPHDPRFNPWSFPYADLRENFCRNPDQEPTGPWCYTTDRNMRTESCGIPRCSEVPCMTCNGEDYRGFMDHSETGKPCRRWDSEHPKPFFYRPSLNPDKDLLDNFCRNPNNLLRPWCYVDDDDENWEYCNIAKCQTAPSGRLGTSGGRHCQEGSGENYRGTVAVTAAGISCQPWSSQSPHSHSFNPEQYSCKALDENYCRNPDDSAHPWCFTSLANIRVAMCNIPSCVEEQKVEACYDGDGHDYRGTASHTRNGLQCVQWDGDGIHEHKFNPTLHPEAGLDGPYCRNPDRDPHGTWCFTNDQVMHWDYCTIKPCDRSHFKPEVKVEQIINGLGDTCGKKKQNSRITFGTKTKSPWTAGLFKNGQFQGGAALVDKEWVLTSANTPISWDRPETLVVRLGMRKVTDAVDDENIEQIPVHRLVCGPPSSKLILLQLVRPTKLKHITPICLPTPGSHVENGTACEVTGWGYTEVEGQYGNLLAGNVWIMEHNLCQELSSETISNNMICAYGGKTDFCEKDYGGPLSCREGNVYVLQGIATVKLSCGNVGHPSHYIRVASFSGWVHKVVTLRRG